MTSGDHERRFPGSPRSVRSAREHVRGCVEEVLHPEVVDDILLVVSELTSNAVSHAGSGFTLRLGLSPTVVRIAVRDHGPGVAAMREPEADRPGGRGLQLVDHLADEWGTEQHADGKTVWAVFAVGSPGRR